MDEQLAQEPTSEFKLKPGQELNSDRLRLIEEKAGITLGTLNYSKDGKLMLLKRCEGSGRYGKGMNAAEVIDDSQKQLVRQSDREALYRLYTRYRQDPAALTTGK